MNRWNDRVRRLLYGRYGPDQLMWALLVLVGIFMLLRWLTGWRMWWIFSVLMLRSVIFASFHTILCGAVRKRMVSAPLAACGQTHSLAREAARDVKRIATSLSQMRQPLRVPRRAGKA